MARGVGMIVGGAVVFFGVIEVLARVDIRRNRALRAAHGDLLHVEQSGRGDPVVLIAGLQGSTRYWGDELDPLTKQHWLIKVDLLGFGRSPWPADVDYTLEDQLVWLRRTLVHHGAATNVTLVGHSMGAIVTAHYAARYPAEVRAVVLAGVPVFSDAADGRRRIRSMSPLAALFSLNPFFAREGCMTMEAFRPLLMRTLPGLMKHRRPEVVEDAMLHHWPSFRGSMQHILLGAPIAPAIKRIGPKTVLIHGRADQVTPLARMQRLAQQSGAELIVVPGGHDEYISAIRDVLAGTGR